MDSARVTGGGAPRARGEAAGLETLMDQYAGRVYRLALNITQNSADAEEVVQDVFFAVFRKFDTFEGRCAFGSWLYRICLNAALNKRRGKRFDLETSMEELLRFHEGIFRAAEIARAVADWPQMPDGRFLTAEARAVLTTALDALPGHYRAVVILTDIEGLRSADVAEVLQESEPCVKSRLHRARLALRERLAYYFFDRQRRLSVTAGVAGQSVREKHSSNGSAGRAPRTPVVWRPSALSKAVDRRPTSRSGVVVTGRRSYEAASAS